MKIFVYKNPILLNTPPSEAFINNEYLYRPKAENMYKDTIENKDVFFSFINSDTTINGQYNETKNQFMWYPEQKDIGQQLLKLTISDQYNHLIEKYVYEQTK